jgi:hypothetical protein
MGKRAKTHYGYLITWFNDYAKVHHLRFDVYSPYHMRLMDEGTVVLDAWTTGKYYVKETNYVEYHAGIIERGTEKGELPVDSQTAFNMFLNRLFNPIDFA